MPFDFRALETEAQEKISQASDISALEELRVEYLGRKGRLAEITASIPTLAVEARPEFGKNANLLKNKLNQFLEERIKALKEKQASNVLNFDFTQPVALPKIGTLHPISQTIEEITSIFTRMGFVIVEGPEIESEYNNFTGLNIPLEHPSRDAFDTFYIRSSVSGLGSRVLDRRPQTADRRLLRSHTSPVQIRVMQAHKPPLAVIVPGKVYRPDAVDASHSFMFHQIEGFLVDKDINFSNLKGVLSLLARQLFGEDIQMRLRPHFFPFTEPSAEVDISCILCRGQRTGDRGQKLNSEPRTQNPETRKCSVCGDKGWLEIMGCGMIHPNVFANVGYPKNKYTGFAFGMGVDRIAMLKHGINDIRLFYENDLRFLRQF